MAKRYTVHNPDGEEYLSPSDAHAQKISDWMIQSALQSRGNGGGQTGGNGGGALSDDSFFRNDPDAPTFQDKINAQRDLIRENSAAALALGAQGNQGTYDRAALLDKGQTTRAGIGIEPEMGRLGLAREEAGITAPARKAEATTRENIANLRNRGLTGDTLSRQQLLLAGVSPEAAEDPTEKAARGLDAQYMGKVMEALSSPDPAVRSWAMQEYMKAKASGAATNSPAPAAAATPRRAVDSLVGGGTGGDHDGPAHPPQPTWPGPDAAAVSGPVSMPDISGGAPVDPHSLDSAIEQALSEYIKRDTDSAWSRGLEGFTGGGAAGAGVGAGAGALIGGIGAVPGAIGGGILGAIGGGLGGLFSAPNEPGAEDTAALKQMYGTLIKAFMPAAKYDKNLAKTMALAKMKEIAAKSSNQKGDYLTDADGDMTRALFKDFANFQ